MSEIIRVEKLKKSFGDLEVLHSIDFSVSSGEVVTIIGASGSGKSTFLRCLNILETPNAGKIMYHGKDILKGEINVNNIVVKLGWCFKTLIIYNKTVLETVLLDK